VWLIVLSAMKREFEKIRKSTLSISARDGVLVISFTPGMFGAVQYPPAYFE
jgi:hypothetical protein